jgi:uncharacterized membrane protein YkvA (DUF1232 family)
MKNPFEKFTRQFSELALWEKLNKYARKAGLKTVYSALLLFYAYTRKETPGWAKNIILGVLGYFLVPIDGLPDLTPVIGYTDDVGVLSFGLVAIACYINDEVRIKARKKLRDWFGEFSLDELAEVDNQL